MGKKNILLNNTNVAIQKVAHRHMLPNLRDHYILSMGRFCDVGCTIMFTSKNVLILLNGEVVLCRIRHNNGLLYVDTEAFKVHHQAEPQKQRLNSITSVYTTKCLPFIMRHSSPPTKPPYLLPSKQDSSLPGPYSLQPI